uniref:fructose-bisphosphate aldolase n=2 Tax=Chromera velia TaxID=505693 RepID=X2D8V8_9ALVE|nr:class I fructose-1,6-bisphosphate aldolase [Chromera velia]|mmetsp:Transcript_30534/g.60022  ORF Transcript_30534/g.60022 Transcript_30534/m.60022 type:complete len:383 (+) Transcript_30534:189-1337(+)|eukprot:Cvel_20853.t1-p1 / transcript=Cvel_20853.t1 / gene=Cvel_20853 / organism=Chromera_velia_CCMP2878 / gene_product=Fructose-bisphosphate aldolase C, putative / transcript_product=Fructose-bisphosphate aldolase C, putative / location=Cvel_scaffold1910:28557-29702(-) / protein_length=382 / sequence_SO=supercontig / SO=protein_coding / is_pseudo=false
MPLDEALLKATVAALTAKGKGILASDESTSTIGKRLEKAGFENTEEVRRQYRELFYTADISSCYGGAIVFKEALYQADSNGVPFTKALADRGVLLGVKVDEGLVPLSPSPNEPGDGSARPPPGLCETTTKGLERLRDFCDEIVTCGARFTKWRAALKIDAEKGWPSETAIALNCQQLSEYALTCQTKGLVPLVEPEILIDGTHSLAEFCSATERVLAACVQALMDIHVFLPGCLLKIQMCIPGADCEGPKPSPSEIATATLDVLVKCIPAEVGGVMFLSGGMSEEEATLNLQAINTEKERRGKSVCPWPLSFSFGRALQASVLEIFKSDQSSEGKEKAKQMAAALGRANGLAAAGTFTGPHPSLSQGSATASLRETFRGWRT